MRPISIKNLRVSLAKVASLAEKGESFVVLRRSTPCFKIIPYTKTEEKKKDPYEGMVASPLISPRKPSARAVIEEIDLADDGEGWEQLIDFTEGGRTKGMPIEKFSEILEKVIAEEDGE